MTDREVSRSLTLYHHALSFHSQIIRLILHFKKAPFNLVEIDFQSNQHLDPKYGRKNKNLSLPTLEVQRFPGGTRFFDSLPTIWEWLDKAFPKTQMVIDEQEFKDLIEKLLSIDVETFEDRHKGVMTKEMLMKQVKMCKQFGKRHKKLQGAYSKKEKHIIKHRIPAIESFKKKSFKRFVKDMDDILNGLEKKLEEGDGKHIYGTSITVADCFVCALIAMFYRCEANDAIDSRTHLASYWRSYQRQGWVLRARLFASPTEVKTFKAMIWLRYNFFKTLAVVVLVVFFGLQISKDYF